MPFKRTALRPILTHVGLLLAFLLISVMYFLPEFDGKTILQPDIVAYKSKSNEITQLRQEHGREILWSNAIFGGMPSVMVNLQHPANKLNKLIKVFRLWVTKRGTGLFLTMMVCFYIMMLSMRAGPWVSAIGAVVYALGIDFILLFEAGHNSKLVTFGYLPLLVAGYMLLWRQKWLWGGVLFTLGVGMSLLGHHPQMLYYMALVLGVGVITYFVQSLRTRQLPAFGKAVAIMALGAALGVATSASYLWTTKDFSASTMRGEPILTQADTDAAPTTSSEVDGLEWNYAMQWSAGWQDMFTYFVPMAVGNGSSARLKSSSATYKFLQRAGARRSADGGFDAPLYWGKIDSTTGPDYVGIGVMLLFFLGMFTLRGPIRWWVGIGTVLLILLSLGRNFEGFQRLFFEYAPFYNKFRAHSSALTPLGLVFGLMGFYTLGQAIQGRIDRERLMKGLIYATGVVGAVVLFFALIGPLVFDFNAARDASYSNADFVEAMRKDRRSMMSASAWRSLFFLLAIAGLMWGWLKEKLTTPVLLAGLAVLMIADLWVLGKTFVNEDSFKDRIVYDQQFEKRPVDEQILAVEPDRSAYRLFDASTFSTNQAAYWHNILGGYHPAKLQRIQDLIDRHIRVGTPSVLNMFNIKYTISQEGQLQQNPNAAGNAWMVEDIQIVGTPEAEINALSNINAANTAVVLDDEFNNYVAGFDPVKGGTIELTSYIPDHLTYSFNAPGEQLVVFSEVWYGPNKGWQAYIDGEPVDHVRANYILRALRVPAGQHTIEFKFIPESYVTGSAISAASSWLVLLGTIAAAGFGLWKWYQGLPLQPAPKPAPTPRAKAKTRRTDSAVKRKKRSRKK